ncbi:TRAFAC clade GTPase domain-containing protein [Thalassovita taeanensis]|uniref:Double-GTPase 2 domain-containing protein n=1 Tax=Thalassovita taeanensis TaxID=657014 RepID=A0A1H9K6D4_9RHOB|nr:hypothetical protein [Thalassovita taeanensis]SEQ94618.1 hypothetical protein SAMN04488092_11749 [Thalassovita taeanensis]
MEDQICSNPDCQIGENGSCLQGHNPVKSCPNFGKPAVKARPADSTETDEAPISEETKSAKVRLPRGEPFTQEDVNVHLLKRPAQMVAIVGDTSSGKSTLICSIYARFHRGPFADRVFAGSGTLTAFEEVGHYARASSGMDRPDTPRTSLSQGLQFFHLATSPANEPTQTADLFLSDRAGESYREGLDTPAHLYDLQEIRLARTVAVLIDGARLIRPEEQHEVLDTARQLVRAMVDSGTLSTAQHLQVILTKRDDIERAGNVEQTVARVQATVERIAQDFGNRLASVTLFEIAARDPQSQFEQAHGCDVLLQSWLSAKEPDPVRVPPIKAINTRFDLLAENREFGEIS